MKRIIAPKIREQCMKDKNGNTGEFYYRPCPYVRCKWHLLWDTNRREFGNFNLLSNDQIIDILFKMPETCCLDFIDKNQTTLDEIGAILFMSRERVRQLIEYKDVYDYDIPDAFIMIGALTKMKHYTRKKQLEDYKDEYID